MTAQVDGSFRHIAQKPYQIIQSLRRIHRSGKDSIHRRINLLLHLPVQDHLLDEQLDLAQSIPEVIVQISGDANPISLDSFQNPNIHFPPVEAVMIPLPCHQYPQHEE